jgi:phage baseplate assembly protein W
MANDIATVIDDIYSQNQFFNEVNAVWPDLWKQRAFVSPARNGMDRRTGKPLQGWDHVQQSMEIIFETPFHERVLRRWVGSFVPRLLGEEIIYRIITRFWWAIAEALELWEPNYRIKHVYFMGNAVNSSSQAKLPLSDADMIRLGQVIFRNEGVYRPRAHLGDFSPEQLRYFAAVSQGGGVWDISPVGGI